MLTATYYTDPDGVQKFKVYEAVSEDEVKEVTDNFECAAVETEDGRTGILLVPKNE